MERNRVGILTLCYGTNYGGTLQCLALQNVLTEMGYDVVVINYKPNAIPLYKRIFIKFATISSFKDFVNNVYDTFIKIFSLKNKKNDCSSFDLQCSFEAFRKKYIRLSLPVNDLTICNVANNLDAIIVGSDQVWGNLGNSPLIYFFDWNPSYKGKRISYAACNSGCTNPPKFNRKKLRKYVEHFSSISVRDFHTQKLLSSIAQVDVKIVVDPTLLYNFEQLFDITIEQECSYILVYEISAPIKGASYKQVFNILKEKYNCNKIIAISIKNRNIELENAVDEIYYDASPILWLKLLRNASFVYTDSYHGAIFSMKFQKQFIAYYTYSSRSTRLLDLKTQFDLKGCIISNFKEIEQLHTLIDYESVNKKIEYEVAKALEYIKLALNE